VKKKRVDINVEAFLYASMANAAAALKGKLGSSVTKALSPSKNMDAANVYAVMNIISFICTIPFGQSPNSLTSIAVANTVSSSCQNIPVSGFSFHILQRIRFGLSSHVGAVTSSVLKHAK
jgi:solute carrier family 35 protein E1